MDPVHCEVSSHPVQMQILDYHHDNGLELHGILPLLSSMMPSEKLEARSEKLEVKLSSLHEREEGEKREEGEVKSYSPSSSPSAVSSSRGHIYSKVDGSLLIPNFGFTENIVVDVQNIEETVSKTLDMNWSEWMFTFSLEGSLLRIYYHQSQWHISTNRKLDAFQSRWSSRTSFGELFCNYIKSSMQYSFQEWTTRSLDTHFVYFFLLRPTFESRIVSHACPREESVFFLGRSTLGHFSFQFSVDFPDVLPNFHRPVEVSITSLEDLTGQMSQINIHQHQGILATHRTSFHQKKFIHPKYHLLMEVRGNNPNLRFRYFELRQDPEKLRLLYYLYPKYTSIFDSFEESIVSLSRLLYRFYVNRYIKNQFVSLPKEEYRVLKQCHEHYSKNKEMNRIYCKKILDILSKESPLNLYKMVKRYNMTYHQRKQQEYPSSFHSSSQPPHSYPFDNHHYLSSSSSASSFGTHQSRPSPHTAPYHPHPSSTFSTALPPVFSNTWRVNNNDTTTPPYSAALFSGRKDHPNNHHLINNNDNSNCPPVIMDTNTAEIMFPPPSFFPIQEE